MTSMIHVQLENLFFDVLSLIILVKENVMDFRSVSPPLADCLASVTSVSLAAVSSVFPWAPAQLKPALYFIVKILFLRVDFFSTHPFFACLVFRKVGSQTQKGHFELPLDLAFQILDVCGNSLVQDYSLLKL